MSVRLLCFVSGFMMRLCGQIWRTGLVQANFAPVSQVETTFNSFIVLAKASRESCGFRVSRILETTYAEL